MDIPEPGEDGFSSVGIAVDPQGRIFIENAMEGSRKLFLVVLALGRDRQLSDRIRKDDGSQHRVDSGAVNCRAGCEVLDLGDGANLTARDFFGIDVVLTHQIEEVVHAGMPGRAVCAMDLQVIVGLHRTGIHAKK